MPDGRGTGGWGLRTAAHTLAFHWNTPEFMLRLARAEGDVAHFRLGRSDAVLLSHPDLVRAVLVEHAGDFSKGRLMQRARRLLGDGLLTSEGETHRLHRRRIQPAFTREQIRGYGAYAVAVSCRRMGTWRRGMRLDLGREMNALTMNVVAGALLGTDLDDQLPALAEALQLLARWAPLLAAPGGTFLERTRLPILGRIRKALDLLDTVIEQRIVAVRGETSLMGALQDDAACLTPGQVRDQVMTIFLAGHDTTAATLTWLWLLLSLQPEVEGRLREELGRVLEGRRPGPDDLDRMPYLDAVVRETLRLYPPIGRIGRRPVKRVQLDGVALEQGMPVFVSPFVTQRDGRWFAEPEQFRPERWAEPAPERSRFAWFPFGAGPRSCIGETFARTVIPLIVATIAQRWRLVALRRTLPPMRPLLTLKPRGTVWMQPEHAVATSPPVLSSN